MNKAGNGRPFNPPPFLFASESHTLVKFYRRAFLPSRGGTGARPILMRKHPRFAPPRVHPASMMQEKPNRLIVNEETTFSLPERF